MVVVDCKLTFDLFVGVIKGCRDSFRVAKLQSPGLEIFSE